MSDPFEKIRQQYEVARADMDETEATQQQDKIKKEYDNLSEEHTTNIQRQLAIEQRRETLSIAASIAALLLVNGVRPENELIYDEPIFEQRGLLRKRSVQTGVRQQIALEGWPLKISESRYTSRNPLTLTALNNINNHPPLVWTQSDLYSSTGAISKEDVVPLHTIPLHYMDREWASPFWDASQQKSLFDDPNKNPQYIPHEPSPAQKDLSQKTLDYLYGRAEGPIDLENVHHLYVKPNYKMYLEAKIEEKLRKALTEVAVKYRLLD